MSSAVVTFKSVAPSGGGGANGAGVSSGANGAGASSGDESARERERELALEKHKKLGHRRIDEQGEVSYKKVPTNALMSAIQLGIANSIGGLASMPNRDLLLQDFEKIESVNFPAQGSPVTPSHSFGDFRFKTYAPIAFRYFRELFHIKPADFLRSICAEPLRELSNAGASGSIFYVSQDDQFIIKTVQHKEADFLQKLLPGYYMNLNQNPRTLLPKFFGLFCYQSLGKNIRLLVMNNLLPQAITMHEKYDVKGSTYKRLASKSERAKAYPTLKDLDFIDNHKDGLSIDPVAFDALLKTISRDCLVLESFKIMDYSLLIGIHNMELAGGSRVQRLESEGEEREDDQPSTSQGASAQREHKALRSRFSVWDAADEGSVPHGGVPARNSNGDRIILYLGIIDILQNYRLLKKMEHTWKAILHDGDSISVHNPSFYAQRFLGFMTEKVFKRGPALKSSPSRRRTARKSVGDEEPPVSTRDVNPTVPSGVARVPLRRSYRSDTVNSEKKEKKTERLFATSSTKTVDEREPLQAPEEDEIFTEFDRVKRFFCNIVREEDVDYAQFESRIDGTDIVTFRENDGAFRLFGTNVHVKAGAYIACLIGFAVTVSFCITYTFYHGRGQGRNPFIDQMELIDLIFAFFVGIPCHFLLFFGIRNEKKKLFSPFLIFYLTNFILNVVLTVITMVAASMDLHRKIFGNIKYDISWSLFQIFFTSAQGLAIYVVMRCRKYVAAKDYWRRRNVQTTSVIADGVTMED